MFQVRTKCLNEPNKPTTQIIKEAVAHTVGAEDIEIPKLENLRRQANRSRHLVKMKKQQGSEVEPLL